MHTPVFLLVLLLLSAQVSNSNCFIVTTASRGSSVVSSINTTSSWRRCSRFSSKHRRSQQQDGVATVLTMQSNTNIHGLKSSLKSLFGPKLILPTIIIVLAMTRPIPRTDRVFSIGYPLYLYLANRCRFAKNAPSLVKFGGGGKEDGVGFQKLPLLREGSGPWFKIYVSTFAIIGVLVPLLTLLLAPQPIAEAAAPHLYLTLCQVMLEAMMTGPKVHSFIELLNPIGFNAYRLLCLKTWLMVASRTVVTSRSTYFSGGSLWEVFGFALALANTILWSYNLFVFLFLRIVPQYLDRNKFPDVDTMSWKGQLIPFLSK